jgi:hypothetical protein
MSSLNYLPGMPGWQNSGNLPLAFFLERSAPYPLPDLDDNVGRLDSLVRVYIK